MNIINTTVVSAALIAGSVYAGEIQPIVAPTPEVSPVSGTLDLSYNTHFVSYGADVWGVGTDFGTDATFNPSINLDYAVTDNLTLSTGVWFDVNGNAPPSIGGDVQEVDFWLGAAYAMGSHSMSVTYQAWEYASDTEKIVDVAYGYDHWLNPSALAHFRVDEGASGGNTGVFFVLGVEPGKEFESFSLSFPVAVAFTPDDFHGGDSGFGYASAGIQASYPFSHGWSLNGGLTGYMTNDEVIPGNVDENFLTGNIGVSLNF